MEKKELDFTFDPADSEGMLNLMHDLGGNNTMYVGMNEECEEIMLSIYSDRIICDTKQSNGWLRRNVYWEDGTREELYQGRWNK